MNRDMKHFDYGQKNYELLKETLVRNGSAYTGRLAVPYSRALRGGDYGITETTGELWQQQRRFVLHVLREFGMGKNLMEERVLTEVADFLEQCRRNVGQEFDLRQNFHAAIGSIINSILFGFRFDENNMHLFLRLKGAMDKLMEIFARPDFVLWMFYPILKYFPYFRNFNKATGVIETDKLLSAMINSQIEEHKAEIDFESEKSTDFVEAFLKEQKRHEDEPDFGGFSMNQLRNVCLDLWFAGMETTSNTLYWGVLYVLLDPEVQKNIHEELDRKIGYPRLITIADRSSLHYMNAVINEVQRLANLLPLNVFHETTEDVVIDGYHIPAGTLFLPQISNVMYDEKVFPEPCKFDPKRHLTAEGAFMKIDEVVPFSMGKRQCAGEGLARMELFLFLANLYNHFEVSQYGDEIPSTKKRFGSTVSAEDFSVVLRERF
ncbi:unnamed protein product [Cylicocyclus nassatus]|uniref:Unspecific monooxygenase n=1 Tax=Cylicocyclus nassatus TaxID=53992 RepID=A0AA36DLM6_CYLNA|nr:unnamed protein product [Cylicocyclus nassatus]